MSHLSELRSASLVIRPIFAILFGVSTSSLFLGFTKYSECPFEPLLPQSLLIFGFIGSICSILALILIVVSFFKVDDSGTHLWYFVYTIIVLAVYGICAIVLAFFIVFVFRTKYFEYSLVKSNDSESFFHTSIYNFCYVFTITVITLVLTYLIWLIRLFGNRLYKFLKKD